EKKPIGIPEKVEHAKEIVPEKPATPSEKKEELKTQKIEVKQKEERPKEDEAAKESKIVTGFDVETVREAEEEKVSAVEEKKRLKQRIEARKGKEKTIKEVSPSIEEEAGVVETKREAKEVRKEETDKDAGLRRVIITPISETKKTKELIEKKEPFPPEETLAKETKKTEITVPRASKRKIKMLETITVAELSQKIGIKAGEIIKKLMEVGIMATINQSIDYDAASLIASEFGHEIESASFDLDLLLGTKEDGGSKEEALLTRHPVVTVMGHVDHGKTSLLDAIRKTKLIESEAGGITQHIGAYVVETKKGKIVFIDTPGHEAFTAMRARGTKITDLVVLVIAADDGVMSQTIEAINHAKAAGVPIIVAINKIDKPGADTEKVKRDLANYDLTPEDWGGDTVFVPISAKEKKGIEDLLEYILLQAEILELKVNPNKPAHGVVLESKLDRGKGPIATILIQEGTLRIGDSFISGASFGKVRAMTNDKGNRVSEAKPFYPVEVQGLSSVPDAGELFVVVKDERKARQISLFLQQKHRNMEASTPGKVTLEALHEQIERGNIKDLNLIIKSDVQGSIEAVTDAVKKLDTNEIKINVIHSGVGTPAESDVMLASASNAIILAFNVRPDQKVSNMALQEKVDLRTYRVIYDVITDIKKAIEGLLEPTYEEEIIGHAQVRKLFHLSKAGMIAGSYVLDGKIVRGAHVHLLRDGVVIYDGIISSLRRFKDDAKEVASGYECGIGIENFNDLQPQDVIEVYVVQEVTSNTSDN
ncbi:MAG: translation initiation factor IF-2, partial [Thermodesulfobacteriota bacterium]|nr:translation initiation factor IF-2 [Thermodesulfobacteriota bacterium]